MSRLKSVFNYALGQVAAIYAHPENTRNRVSVSLGFFSDQLGARLPRGQLRLCPFLDGRHLVLSRYTAPAVHWAPVGCMHDYEEMRLFYDVLTAGDVLVDVGANAGAFSVLGIARGCGRVVAFEPSPKTRWLAELNFRINGADATVHEVRAEAVGASRRMVNITSDLGGPDHLLSDLDAVNYKCKLEVPMVPLDDYAGLLTCDSLFALKIDAEGFDLDVLQGAHRILSKADFAVVSVEGNRNQRQIQEFMLSKGFDQVRYRPSEHQIFRSSEFTVNKNGLFVKGLDEVVARLSTRF